MFRRRGQVDLLDTQEMATFFEPLEHFNLEQLLSLGAAWQSTSR